MPPVVRVSVLRCEAHQFDEFEVMMREFEPSLVPGLKAMRGLRAYYAGSDRATLSLTNVSVWNTLDDAKQMDVFQPMLDAGKKFAEKGAKFERPIMNYGTLWQIP